MESGQGVFRKGRKLASSRRRQTREPAGGQDAPVAPEPESWSSQAEAELQGFFQACGAQERGFVTREDLEEAKFSFLGGEEEPQMIFDWMDPECRGRLSLEEFSSGLKNVFGSSSGTHRLRRTQPPPPPPSQRVSVITSFPALEEADVEDKEAFLGLVGQLGSDHSLSEQAELWQRWGRLRQEEPQLAGNLEGFLAKMRGRLQEARADQEALQRMLRRRDSGHRRAVQQLCEEASEQIRREKRQLQAQSDSRGLALNAHMQEALEAKEREVQRLAEGQRELEAQLHDLSSTQQKASSENRQLREAEQDLAGKLDEVRGQLQVARGRLDAARGPVSWQIEERQSVPRASDKKALGPQAASPEEAPLPGLFGDSNDWDQLLDSFGSPPHTAVQLAWSPPPTPRDTSGPQTPRVVRQISISSPQAFAPEQASDPDGAPRSPSGVPSSTKDQTGTLEDPKEENKGPKQLGDTRFLWDFPGAPAGKSGSLETAALGEPELPPQEHSLSPQAPAWSSPQRQASLPDDQGPEPGLVPAKLPSQVESLPRELHAVVSSPGSGSQGDILKSLRSLQSVGQVLTEGPVLQGDPDPVGKEGHPGGLQETHRQAPRPDARPASTLQSPEEQPEAGEGNSADGDLQDLGSEQVTQAHGLDTGHPEWPQQDGQPAPPQSDMSWAPVEAEIPAVGKLTPLSVSAPTGAQPGAAGGVPESTQTHPILAEREAQPRPLSMPVLSEKEPGPLRSKEPGVDSGEAKLPSSLGDPTASKPQADPDYLFHVIFVGDSNVGKTSFLHQLHHDSFATGLTATVGVDFRVKSLLVDNKCFALQLWDTAGQERYHSLTRQLLRKADGVVLMYDVTSRESFAHVRYWLACLQDAGADPAVLLLLGNKMDCEEKRQVPTEAGRRLAQELGVSFSECSAALGHNILEPMVNLARSLKIQEERLKGSLVEVTPQKPPKRSSCCS